MTLDKNIQISVVVPVYNAAKFLRRCVLSANSQHEVEEIILVEDGSTDNSLAICQELVQEYKKVKLFTHPNNKNLGAAASRNLGILSSKCQYIAFLDADDYFLESRFKLTAQLLRQDHSINAIYEPVGCTFEDEKSLLAFCTQRGIAPEKIDEYITYPTLALSGKELFYSMIFKGKGRPCTDGITVEKELLIKAGLFNPNLRQHQDTELWIKLAYLGNFATPNSKTAVAIRTLHPNNRITHRNTQSTMLLYESLYKWSQDQHLDKEIVNSFLTKYLSSKAHSKHSKYVAKIVWRIEYLWKSFFHKKINDWRIF